MSARFRECDRWPCFCVHWRCRRRPRAVAGGSVPAEDRTGGTVRGMYHVLRHMVLASLGVCLCVCFCFTIIVVAASIHDSSCYVAPFSIHHFGVGYFLAPHHFYILRFYITFWLAVKRQQLPDVFHFYWSIEITPFFCIVCCNSVGSPPLLVARIRRCDLSG